MKRDIGLDAIRSIALIFVIAVHFLAYTGFYEEETYGVDMFIGTCLRVIFVTCVPLFLLLSGWLQSDKMPTKFYYIKILRIIFLYIACGILCQTFIAVVDRNEFTVAGAILSFFDFTAAHYAWYIEMYLGLYLLIPFFNILWKNLKHKQKLALVSCLIILTILPSIFNNFNFNNDLWWQASTDDYSGLIPDWWINIYPIAYYFVGLLIKDNEDRIRNIKLKNYYLAIPLIILLGGENYLTNYSGIFNWNMATAYYGYQCFIISVTIFCLCLKIKLKNKIFKTVFSMISKYSLGAYMISYIYDRIVYHFINKNMCDFGFKIMIYPVAVSVILLFSILTSFVLTNIVEKILQKIYESCGLLYGWKDKTKQI